MCMALFGVLSVQVNSAPTSLLLFRTKRHSRARQQSLVFPRKPERINQFSFQKHRFMSRMVISYQLGYFAVGLALQRVVLAEMNPAVDRPDSIDPALPVLAQEFAAISSGFIEPEFPVLCQKAINQFDLRIGDAWFAPNDGRTATLGIALVRPSAFYSVLDFNVCQSIPEVCQGHLAFPANLCCRIFILLGLFDLII